jgi:D-3-phosphoglycerate dehydrogenase
MQKKFKILVITPIDHIPNVKKNLKKLGIVKIIEDPIFNDLKKIIHKYDVIFTNPNKSKIFIGKEILKFSKKLKIICTASTGTNHLDNELIKSKGIKIISLTKDLKIIKKIPSTAELAFALTLCSLKNIMPAIISVKKKQWDYLPYVGNQLKNKKVGIVGLGRLGTIYARYCKAFGAKIMYYDPKIANKKYTKLKSINSIFKNCDIISLHIHINNKTKNLINSKNLSLAKKDLILINTARGEIINEKDLIDFLKKNKKAKFAADVISDEINSKKSKHKLIKYSKKNKNIIITPHIGGMTIEAQSIAYNRIVDRLKNKKFN